ncbi:hypothetical protein HOD83_02735 [Candidatus Woesearchaeota archaeon]|jgi:hypothetical protein|nr:hypothetical protein [Candidatus Woesearchaeota archaeon]MBT4114602.1 hypothetical protein [Candidatus Woesearchaeota archaeon]MBT4248483.1 hypothetical protein [Candidatus Woesearchaeota archaeon]
MKENPITLLSNAKDSDLLKINEAQSLLSDCDPSISPSVPYFVLSDDIARTSYCVDCIDAAVEQAREDEKEPSIVSSGGWTAEESSDIEVCGTCKKLLDYTLCDTGLESELSHFENETFDINDPRICYQLERILEGYNEWNESIDARILTLVDKILGKKNGSEEKES